MNDIVPIMHAMQNIIYISHAHHAVIESRAKDIGMHRSMHMMLSYLSKFEKKPSQKELAEKMQISAAAVTATIDKLESEGYIEKIPHDIDRRTNIIQITQKGHDILSKTNEIFAQADKEAFGGLDDGEIECLCAYLDVICRNLTDMKNAIV